VHVHFDETGEERRIAKVDLSCASGDIRAARRSDRDDAVDRNEWQSQ